jgi:hypothetical protein
MAEWLTPIRNLEASPAWSRLAVPSGLSGAVRRKSLG